MKKKIFAMITAFALTAAIMPQAYAATAEGTYGTISWSLDGGTLTISGSGEIPEDIIWDNDLYTQYSGDVRTLVVESGITSIGKGAFTELGNLSEVILADTVTSIGEDAFIELGNLSQVTMTGVKTIGGSAFKNTALTEDYATLPASLEVIGDEAFYGTKYTEFNIPASVRSIGKRALESVNSNYLSVDSANPYYSSEDNVLFNKNKTELIYYPKNNHFKEYIPRKDYEPDTYEIPQTVRKIDDYAFNTARLLGKIVIPASVEEIGAAAFNNYILTELDTAANSNFTYENGILYDTARTRIIVGLTKATGQKVEIADTVTEIADGAFELNDVMTELVLPKNLQTIGKSAFAACDLLEKVTMYPSVTTIDRFAFSEDEAISKVYFYGTNSQWSEICQNAERNNENLTRAKVEYMVSSDMEPAFNSLEFQKDVQAWCVQFFPGTIERSCTAIVVLRTVDEGEILGIKTISLTPESSVQNVVFDGDDYISHIYGVEATVYCWENLNNIKPVWDSPLSGRDEE